MGRVKEKIEGLESRGILGKKPYFFPLFRKEVPVKHPTLLLPYTVALDPVPYIPIDRDNTLTMVESGGYLEKAPSNPRTVLRNQLRVKPDLVLTLDLPMKKKGKGTDLSDVSVEEKEWRLRTTLRNAEYAMKEKWRMEISCNWQVELVGVIQGYDLTTVLQSTKMLSKMGFRYYALGAIPTKIGKERFEGVEWCKRVRQIIGEEAWLHVLGVGNVDVLEQIKAQIDSFDIVPLYYPLPYYIEKFKKHLWSDP